MAKITEEDILAGELVSEGSFLSRLINNNISSAQASLTGASVRLGSDLSVQYHLKISDTALLSLGSPSMQFTLNGETVTVKDYQLQNGEYLFTLRGIAPQMIRDSIDATAFVGDTRLCAHWNYSIYQNCMNLLQKDADALKISEEQYRAMTALISDLLIYGAAAQDYTKYDPSAPILDGSEALTPSVGMPLTEDKPTNKESTDERVAFVGATVRFDTDNKLRIKLFIDTSVTSSATLLVNGTEVSVSELEDLGSGFYRYTGEAVKATEFERVYNFSIAINGTEHATLRYSILAYAYDACQSAETSEQMKALALATYRYGKSAVLYAQTHEE
jgi:hypothetical protein